MRDPATGAENPGQLSPYLMDLACPLHAGKQDARHVAGRKGQGAMSGLGDKIKGKAQEAVGATKEGLGKATDNPDMQGEGMADKARGQGNQIRYSSVKRQARAELRVVVVCI